MEVDRRARESLGGLRSWRGKRGKSRQGGDPPERINQARTNLPLSSHMLGWARADPASALQCNKPARGGHFYGLLQTPTWLYGTDRPISTN